LKRSFREYQDASLYYNAELLAELLADHYLDSDFSKVAGRYLQLAQRLAGLIGNPDLVERLERRRTKAIRSLSSRSPLLRLLSDISELLSSARQYKVTQARILKYAIDLSGAERGVLLLYDETSGKLRIEASLDCDRESISDIKEISHSVIEAVINNKTAFLIDDATKHRATREYRSIIRHNILSIACIPLLAEDKPVGILYLDHHTIPAMFTQEDHQVIRALGNFAAVALQLTGHIRKLTAETSQSDELLHRYGIKNPIITGNRLVQDLLVRLQVIANSTASILLCGESGTGKELLARRIHAQSGRDQEPFVAVNCNELQGEMADSRLFGVEKGAATGVLPKEGIFDLADGGTLFLDRRTGVHQSGGHKADLGGCESCLSDKPPAKRAA
jgi:Nif-specific regulatory protein